MATASRFVVLYATEGGRALAEKIKSAFPEAESVKYKKGVVEKYWNEARALVFIMASGIAVRSIATLIKDKSTDPAVLVMDEKVKHVVSLLGGHEAGANALTEQIAGLLESDPVITTGTDANALTSIDVFAKRNGLIIENRAMLPKISSRHIEKGSLTVYNESGLSLPEDLKGVKSPEGADVVISARTIKTSALVLRPASLVLGIGLNSGTPAEEVNEALSGLMNAQGLSLASLHLIATHEKKKVEPGLQEFASQRGLKIVGFTTQELNEVEGVKQSEAAMKALSVKAVAEPSALLASGTDQLLVGKQKIGNVTLALAESKKRKLYVVGTGPGGLEHITPAALHAIRESDVVLGFRSYIDLIEPLLEGKDVVSSAMTQEVGRAGEAVDLASSGKKVCMISGGDPGVYAMAGLVYEVVRSRRAPVDVEVVPGISALGACAARLGAPLMHDFSAISLSDRLTPWDVIEQRLEAAAKADFVIVLYNPKSKGRKTHIDRAREIILRHRAPETPVGIVRAAMREDEDVVVTDLARMLEHTIDMKSTVVIGNSKSFRWHDRLITPRGYERKYDL